MCGKVKRLNVRIQLTEAAGLGGILTIRKKHKGKQTTNKKNPVQGVLPE